MEDRFVRQATCLDEKGIRHVETRKFRKAADRWNADLSGAVDGGQPFVSAPVGPYGLTECRVWPRGERNALHSPVSPGGGH